MSRYSNACATVGTCYVCCVSNCFAKMLCADSKRVAVGRSALWTAQSSKNQARQEVSGGFYTAYACRVWRVTFSKLPPPLAKAAASRLAGCPLGLTNLFWQMPATAQYVGLSMFGNMVLMC